jgi:hypothetical protein
VTLLTLIIALQNTGAEPFIEFRATDAWILAFAPGLLVALWGIVAVLGVRPRFSARKYRSATILILWCALGLTVAASVPWMYFSDLSRYAKHADEPP